ncbi:hypothetical protein E4U41_004717 [Claviceps citrina]|nr:hypothetical protein E4U41_004717 [Claviceps citrina]
MDATARSTSSSLPQGFSVYQPMLGAPLQFFPVLGSQEIEDMINAFIPGPLSAGEKRATVTLDFFEHAQMTGQTFKFYPVHCAPAAAVSPLTTSPSVDSTNSSYNLSPLTFTWDWSATSSPPEASSVRDSSQGRREPRSSGGSISRHQTTDLTHLPGMKILTKDGLDVTNVASRGSKSKEQREHAHLMRIIKACDSCRRKKIRCDPSHKKRGAAQAASHQSIAKPAEMKNKKKRKARPVASEASPPVPSPVTTTNADVLLPGSSSLELDPTFSLIGLQDFDPAVFACDPMEEFFQFPPMDNAPDFDFLLPDTNARGLLETSPLVSAALSTPESATPSSQQETGVLPGSEFVHSDPRAEFAEFSMFTHPGSSIDYTDFALYSPSSSLSEDEPMLSIGSTGQRLHNLTEAARPQYQPAPSVAVSNGGAIERSDHHPPIDDLSPFDHGDNRGDADGARYGPSNMSDGGQLAATTSVSEPGHESYSNLNATPIPGPMSQPVTSWSYTTSIVDHHHTSPDGLTLADILGGLASYAPPPDMPVEQHRGDGVTAPPGLTLANTPRGLTFSAPPLGGVLAEQPPSVGNPITADRSSNMHILTSQNASSLQRPSTSQRQPSGVEVSPRPAVLQKVPSDDRVQPVPATFDRQGSAPGCVTCIAELSCARSHSATQDSPAELAHQLVPAAANWTHTATNLTPTRAHQHAMGFEKETWAACVRQCLYTAAKAIAFRPEYSFVTEVCSSIARISSWGTVATLAEDAWAAAYGMCVQAVTAAAEDVGPASKTTSVDWSRCLSGNTCLKSLPTFFSIRIDAGPALQKTTMKTSPTSSSIKIDAERTSPNTARKTSPSFRSIAIDAGSFLQNTPVEGMRASTNAQRRRVTITQSYVSLPI